jgi:hypothetical protein
MKKGLLLSLFLFVSLTGFFSCKKVIKSVFGGTDITIPEYDVTIPAVAVVTSYEVKVGTYSYEFNLDSAIRSNTAGLFGANAVNSIKLKRAIIIIKNSDSLNNLANFDSARVTIESNTNNVPVNLFSVGFPDSLASNYSETPANSPELISYLKGSNIIFTMYGILRRATTKPLNVAIDVVVRAD